MATDTITINERTQIGRSVLHLMRELSSVFAIKKSQQSKEEANMSKEEFFAKIDDARASSYFRHMETKTIRRQQGWTMVTKNN